MVNKLGVFQMKSVEPGEFAYPFLGKPQPHSKPPKIHLIHKNFPSEKHLITHSHREFSFDSE